MGRLAQARGRFPENHVEGWPDWSYSRIPLAGACVPKVIGSSSTWKSRYIHPWAGAKQPCNVASEHDGVRGGALPSVVELLLAVVLNRWHRRPVCLLLRDRRDTAGLCAVLASLRWLPEDFEESKAEGLT